MISQTRRDVSEAVGRRVRFGAWLAVVLCLLHAKDALAGPPYVTDDPEPVELHHWEFYLASQTERDRDGWFGTAPHVEVNYGAIENVQLHVIAPLAYRVPDGGRGAYGVGDVELGIKFRFLAERKWTPMIGTFPLVEVPTGSRQRGLGNGTAQIFIPVWVQKTIGEWTTYGGWGVWLDTGNANRHWWFFGWQAQRKLGEHLALGAELFHETPEELGASSDTRFNLGAIIDVNDSHHVIFSAGRSIVGVSQFQAYLAYQLTVGPHR
jgi:hypothetical protein